MTLHPVLPPPADPSSEQLIRQIAAGDQAALRLLMNRHGPILLAQARRMLGGTTDADEVVQEAFIRAWRFADRFTVRPGGVGAWLRRIVANLCVDRLRRPVGAGLDEIAEPVDPAPSAEMALLGAETRLLVTAALAALPDRQRLAIALCYYDGMSNAEAAEVLALSVSALEALLVRGRRTLRARLAGVLGMEVVR